MVLNFKVSRSQITSGTSTSNLIKLDYSETLQELTTRFKGKIIYLDIMASWCKPCIEEFKYTKQLDDYFQENDIVKIYITIDEKDAIQKAYHLIEENALSGYFASYHNPMEKTVSSDYTNFIDDLLFVIDDNGNKNFKGIPAYSILDKEGKIVVKDALRPSSLEKLKQQLSKYL